MKTLTRLDKLRHLGRMLIVYITIGNDVMIMRCQSDMCKVMQEGDK